MTLSLTDGVSWTHPSGRWDVSAPFAYPVLGEFGYVAAILAAGRAAIAAIPKSTLLRTIAVGLGIATVADAFSGQPSFEEGWEDGKNFDERMAMMHQMWLKLNDRISSTCPAFVDSPAIAEYRQDRDRFGAFYSATGRVSERAASYVGMTPSPSATEIGTAKTFWGIIVGWIAQAEKMCPGKVAPGLAEMFEVPEPEKGTNWAAWAIGGGVVLLGLAAFAVFRRQPAIVVSSPPPLSELDFALVRRRRRRGYSSYR